MGANELPARFELAIFGLRDRRLTPWPRKLHIYYFILFKSFLTKKKEAKETGGTFLFAFSFYRFFWVSFYRFFGFHFIVFFGFHFIGFFGFSFYRGRR